MEKKQLYCIYDKKAERYDGFMLFNNTAEAIRAFQLSVEKNETLKRWAEDYQFVRVTEIKFNKDGFLINGLKNEVTVIAEAKDFVVVPEKTENDK